MNSKIAIVVAAIIVLGGGFYLYHRKEAQAPSADNNQIQSDLTQNQGVGDQTNPPPAPAQPPPAIAPTGKTTTKNNPVGPDPSPGTFSSGQGGTDGSDIAVVEIDYDGNAFSPGSVDIKAGDYVMFVNKSSGDFWPASNPHPTHTDYPGFDALKPIAAGDKYNFQFNNIGNWGFHDHLNPLAHGTINVSAK